jgi:hypothetical protein
MIGICFYWKQVNKYKHPILATYVVPHTALIFMVINADGPTSLVALQMLHYKEPEVNFSIT